MEIPVGQAGFDPSNTPSMRPRPFGHGNATWRSNRWPSICALQCGHDLSAMEITSTCPSIRCMTILQCGHDLSAMEITDPKYDALRAFDLQCGHDLSAMEIADRRGISLADSLLQCGHDLSAMEMSPCGAWHAGPGCPFNAATTFRPWKFAPMILARELSGYLQCGHDLSAMAISRSTIRFGVWGALQCGHDLSAMEIRHYGYPRRCGKAAFNAATTFRPWKSGRTSWAAGN